MKMDVAIIGGSAAGLATAIFTAEQNPNLRIVVLDGARKLGAKILVSGGGRCNVTNDVVEANDFHGAQKRVRNILRGFSADAARAWFASLGVELKVEATGKLFPVTDSAKSVLAALLDRCEALGVELRPAHRVVHLEPSFVLGVQHQDNVFELKAERVVLATGGRALPRSGSDGWGLAWAREAGLRVSDVHPALVPLCLGDVMFHKEVSGVTVDAQLELVVQNKVVERRRGSLLFTHTGISGPVALDISHSWGAADASRVLRVSVQPGLSFEELDALLASKCSHSQQALSNAVFETLPQRVPKSLVAAMLKHVGCDASDDAGALTRERRRALVHALVNLELPVTGDQGWHKAEVTAGGIELEEFDSRLECRKIPGLYAVGEVLNVDGRLGGFNFQWAWSTGRCVGEALGRSFS